MKLKVLIGLFVLILLLGGGVFINKKINLFKTNDGKETATGETQESTEENSLKLVDRTSVTSESLAAKIDYARKVVRIKTVDQKSEFEKAVKELGGEIISQNNDIFVIQLSKDKVAQESDTLSKNSAVESIDTDYPVAVLADQIDWGIERVFAPKVWETTTGNQVKIAVLDTGIDTNHTELSSAVLSSYNFVNETTDVTDGHGHGTHVAGTIASVKNDAGYIGASYEAKLMIGKVLADDGSGYLSDVVEGIDWAKQNGAKVINLSLGTDYNSKLLEDAVNSAYNAGVIVVAAAGNNYGGSLLYPAAYSSAISVGATDSQDKLASFSAIGADLVAPGVSITSTLPGNKYAAWSGTSMAAPHISAAAALLISNGTTNVRDRLFENTVDLGVSGKDSYYGYGLVNIEAAVNGKDILAPLVTILEPVGNATVSGKVLFKANVTDESGIKSVSFKLGETQIKSFTTEPYEIIYDTTKLENGTYEFLVTAIDQNENTAYTKVVITIKNTTTSMPNQEGGGVTGDEVRKENRPDSLIIPDISNYGKRINQETSEIDSDKETSIPINSNYPANNRKDKNNL